MLAIIGGTGLDQFPELKIIEQLQPITDYGDCSAPLILAELSNKPVVFLPRHGPSHAVAPHQINYRANIKALKDQGVTEILAINAVGGIGAAMAPGTLVVPEQIIDYSYGREHSFNLLAEGYVNHIDFTHPYSPSQVERLCKSLASCSLPFERGAVYGCTQGPRLETAAEIQRLKRDGCDLVGMTAMPEAALARELAIEYAALCLVVNWGAGLTRELLDLNAMLQVLAAGMGDVKKVIAAHI